MRTLAAHKIGTDDADLLAYLKKFADSDENLPRVDALVAQLADEEYAKRADASKRLVAVGPVALPALRESWHSSDLDLRKWASECRDSIVAADVRSVASAAVRLLASRKNTGAVEALLAYLPYCDDEQVEWQIYRNLELLGAGKGKIHPALEKALRAGRVPARRAVAGCLLGRLGSEPQKEMVRQRLTDPDPLVRLRCAQGLLAAKDSTPVPALIELLKAPLPIAWQAEELLRFVADEKAPDRFIEQRRVEYRDNCIEAWRSWWKERNAHVDWEALQQSGRLPGFVLVAGPRPVCYSVWWPLDEFLCDLLDSEGPDQPPLRPDCYCARLYGNDGHVRAEWVLGRNDVEQSYGVRAVRNLEGIFFYQQRNERGRPLDSDPEPSSKILLIGEFDQDGHRSKDIPDENDPCVPFPLIHKAPSPQTIRTLLQAHPNMPELVRFDFVDCPAVRRRSNGNTVLASHGDLAALHRIAEIGGDGKHTVEFVIDGDASGVQPYFELLGYGFHGLFDPRVDIDSMSYIVRRLDHADAKVRRQAAYKLLKNNEQTPELFAVLLEHAGDSDSETAALIESAVLKFRDSNAALAALRHRNPHARAIAIVLITQLERDSRLPDAIDRLLAGLHDESRVVRERAIQMLADCNGHDDKINSRLIALLTECSVSQRDVELFHAVAGALWHRGHIPLSRVEPILLKVLKGSHVGLRREATAYLAQFGFESGDSSTETRRYLLELVRTEKDLELRRLAMCALSSISPITPELVTEMIKLTKRKTLTRAQARLRWNAVEAFGRLKLSAAAKPAIPTLLELLQDDREAPGLRVYALKSLVAIDRRDERVITALDAAEKDGNHDVARAAEMAKRESQN